jgi:glutathione S-transferase
MPRCYTRVVPTIRPRHVITETADIARALDDAAKRWPEDSHDRRRLLLRLVEQGHRMALDQHDVRDAERRAAVLRTSGALTGVYGENYLAELRQDWPG